MAMAQQEDSTVMLSTFAPLSVNSAKHLDAHRDRPFAAAQGDKGALRVTRKGHPMQRRALSALWNPGPVSQIDADWPPVN